MAAIGDVALGGGPMGPGEGPSLGMPPILGALLGRACGGSGEKGRCGGFCGLAPGTPIPTGAAGGGPPGTDGGPPGACACPLATN